MSIKYNDEIVFIVRSKEKDKLDKAGIEYETLEKGNYYVVTQGKKNKKFTNNEVRQIKEDLNNGMSIRKCAERWNCSTNVIMKVKRNTY